ncbi:MAG TPA: heme-binding protein [Acidocella sp.]|nr:heme-binding protein [Acidocella sp.]
MLDLETAKKILDTALAHAVAHKFKPMAIVVLDARGAMKAFVAQDGTSLKRAEIAIGKAHGALAMGMGTRALMQRAETQPYFIAAATAAVGGALIPVPGGVLIKKGGAVVGAIGLSGDTSDNDEAAAFAAISAAGLEADGG